MSDSNGKEVMTGMPNRTSGAPQIQAGGCVVYFTQANADAIDDEVAACQQVEDIEAVIAQLTSRRDAIQDRLRARLDVHRRMNAEMHARLVAGPLEVRRFMRVRGIPDTDPSQARLAELARHRKAALGGDAPSAA